MLRASRNRLDFWPYALAASTSTLTICDAQGIAPPRAIVISQTGRVRLEDAARAELRSMNPRARGFTLVESLIALLLLSVGLLGAGMLLLGGLRSHAEALRQHDRTEPGSRPGGSHPRQPAGAHGSTTRAMRHRDAQACDPALPCEPAQRASSDLAHFMDSARRLLPGGETLALVEFEPAIGPAAPDRYAITLRWRGPRDPVDASNAVTLHLLAQPVAG